MTYNKQEIETFETRWESYINDFDRLKLAVPAEDMERIGAAQDELRASVESAVESFEEEL